MLLLICFFLLSVARSLLQYCIYCCTILKVLPQYFKSIAAIVYKYYGNVLKVLRLCFIYILSQYIIFRTTKGDRRGFSLSSKLRSSFKGSCNSLKDMDTVSPSSTPVGFVSPFLLDLIPPGAIIPHWVIYINILANPMTNCTACFNTKYLDWTSRL